MGKKNHDINYNMLIKTTIYDIKHSYNMYKENQKKIIDSTWVNDDGNFCMSNGVKHFEVEAKFWNEKFIKASEKLKKLKEEYN